MRVAFLLLIGMLFVACNGQVPAAGIPLTPSSTLDAASLASKTVALVYRKSDGELRPFCSGVWVAQTKILTANHCVRDLDMGDVVDYVTPTDVFEPNSVHERNVISSRASVLVLRDAEHDLALLSSGSAPSQHGVASVSAAPLLPGAPVQTMGSPLGMYWSYSVGEVAAIRELESNDLKMVFVQATAPISPGSSGGGLFDAMGQLVGICHGSFVKGQNMNLWIHYQYIGALLQVQGRF